MTRSQAGKIAVLSPSKMRSPLCCGRGNTCSKRVKRKKSGHDQRQRLSILVRGRNPVLKICALPGHFRVCLHRGFVSPSARHLRLSRQAQQTAQTKPSLGAEHIATNEKSGTLHANDRTEKFKRRDARYWPIFGSAAEGSRRAASEKPTEQPQASKRGYHPHI